MDKDLKPLQEVNVEQDAHHRMLCAVERRPYAHPAEQRKKVARLAEALRRGELLVDGPRPADAYARLTAAVRGETYVPLPAGSHHRLAEALGAGGPALPHDAHARLARALHG